MSFSRGFSSGFSTIMDAKRLRMQEEQIENQRLRDEQREQRESDQEFGYYTDASGGRVDKSEAVTMNDDGTVTGVKDGYNFVSGQAAYRSALTDVQKENLKALQFNNSPRMRALVQEKEEFLLQDAKNRAKGSMLTTSRGETTDLNIELETFYSAYDEFVENPSAWERLNPTQKHMFSQSQAATAKSIENRYGVNPLDIFLDGNVEGYGVAADLQNIVMKNPDLAGDLNLEDYGSGLSSLFNLQTKNYIGKKFVGGGVEGVIKNVELDFSNYKIDYENNTLILRGNYEVEKTDGTTQTVNGVLNDTNRDIIRADAQSKDEVALSLNDLIDYTSAGASMFAYMSDPKYAEFVKQGKKDSITYARMFPSANPSEAAQIQNQAESDFDKQQGIISRKFNNIQGDIIYSELFGKRKNYTETDIRKEVGLVNGIINTFPDFRSYLEETDEPEYQESNGLRIKRGQDGELMPLYELQTYGMKSYEEIYNSYVRGDSNIFTDEFKTTYTFSRLENDLNDGMSLEDVQAEFDKLNPNIYKKLTAVLEGANMPVTTTSVLNLAKSLDETGNLR